MTPGDAGIFGGHPNMAPAARIIFGPQRRRLRHRHVATADAQVQGSVDFRILEFHQDIVAGNAHLRRAESHERGDIETAHPDNLQTRNVGGEAQQPRGGIVEGRLRFDAGAAQQRHRLVQDAALGQGNDQFLGHLHSR